MSHPAWWPTEGEEPDPRWSLANERTLLAYNRTALALVVAGAALSGSQSFTDLPVWFAAVGLPLIAVGAVVGGTSRRRFLDVQRAMRTGEALPAPTTASFLPRAVAVVALLALVAGAVELFA